jgi:predicted double-glycine peptidase
VYFIDPSHPNKPGSLWQFERNILLNSSTEGLVALDILKNRQVGGIEFYNRLQKRFKLR